MVRIFKANGENGEVIIQTTCLDADSFLCNFAEALAIALKSEEAKGDEDFFILNAMQKAMPISYKLSGYKSDEVREERTLVCGNVPVERCAVVATAGR